MLTTTIKTEAIAPCPPTTKRKQKIADIKTHEQQITQDKKKLLHHLMHP